MTISGDAVITTRSTFPTVAVTEMNMTASSSVLTVIELPEPKMEPIFYAVGILSVLALLLVILAILLLLMLIRKRRITQKQRKQRKGKRIALCIYMPNVSVNLMSCIGNSRQGEETTIV